MQNNESRPGYKRLAGVLAVTAAGSAIGLSALTSGQPGEPPPFQAVTMAQTVQRPEIIVPFELFSPNMFAMVAMLGFEQWRNALDDSVEVSIGDHGTVRINDELKPIKALGTVIKDQVKTKTLPDEKSATGPNDSFLSRDQKVQWNTEFIIKKRLPGGGFRQERWAWVLDTNNPDQLSVFYSIQLLAVVSIQEFDASGNLTRSAISIEPHGSPPTKINPVNRG